MLFDTDVLIDHFHGHRAATEFVRQAFEQGDELYISVVSVTEVLAGMCQGEEVKTRALLNLFVRWPISEEIAKMAGDYLNHSPAATTLIWGMH